MKHAAIFDFDGTIADSFEYVFEYLRAESKNTQKFTAAEFKRLRMMSMRRLALHLGVPVWRLPYTYIHGRNVMRAHMEHVGIFRGMEAAIRQLHADGVQLFIVSSNSTHNIRSFLKRYDLQQYFTAIRGSAGMMGKRSVIRRLMLRYGLHKDATWYVGDETGDVVSAAAAGLPCLAVSWGFADPERMAMLKPAATAKVAADIPKLLGKAWKKK